MTNQGGQPRVRLAGREHAGGATQVLREAARWLIDMGRPLWTIEQFQVEEIAARADHDELVGGFSDDELVACMLIDTADLVCWPEKPPGSALYLHKIAVRRAQAGQGWSRALIDFSKAEARRRGLALLRLDCDPRAELLGLYRSLGFTDIGPYQPLGGFLAQRFEMAIAA